MRMLFRVLIGLVAITLGAVIIVPFFIDVNHYKPQISEQAQKYLGRELKIDGPIKAGIFPSPHISLEGVRLANDPRSKSIDMLSVKKVNVHVELLPLLTKHVNITNIKLVEPVFELEEYADKTNNWEFISKLKKQKNEESKTVIKINEISIKNATINYKKPYVPTKTFSNVDLEIHGDVMQGPIKASLELMLNNEKLKVDLKTHKLNFEAPFPFEADWEYAGHKIRSVGNFDIKELNFKGKVKGELGKLSEAMQRSAFESDLIADLNYVNLSNLKFEVNNIQSSGSIKYGIKGQTISVNLKGLPGSTSVILNTALGSGRGYAGSVILKSANLKTLFDTFKFTAPPMVNEYGKNVDLTTDFHFVDMDNLGVKGMNLNLNGAELYGDASKKGEQININLRAPKSKPWTNMCSLKINELEGVRVSGHFSGNVKKLKMDLNLNIRDGNIKARGQLNDIITKPEFDIQTEVSDPDLNRLLRGCDVKPLPIGARDFQFSGHLKGTTDNLSITSMRGSITPKARPISFSGNADLNLKGSKKDIKFSLALGDLGINDMFANNVNRMRFMLASYRNEAHSDFKGWSREPLDLSFLNNFDLEGDISARSLTFKDYKFDNVVIPLTIRNGQLSAPIVAKMAGGSMNCRINLDSNNNLVADLSLINARLDEIITSKSKVSGGQVTLNVKVKGSGGSQAQIVNSLNGDFALQTNGTKIYGLDKAGIIGGLGHVKDWEGVVGLLAKQTQRRETPTANIIIRADISNGVATIKEGSLKAEGIDSVITGNINLPAYKLDVKTVNNVSELKNGKIDVNFYGPIDNPQNDFDPTKLASLFAKDKKDGTPQAPEDLAGDMIGKLMGKHKKTDASNSNNSNDKRDQVKEVVSGLLGEFLKK